MTTKETATAFAFFTKHGGGIVGRRAASALALARAEIAARNLGWSVRWEYDEDADLGDHEYWCAGARRDAAGYTGDGERAYSYMRRLECPGHETTCAVLQDEHGNVLDALGGILDADSDYRRVVAAELALEALPEPIPVSALYECIEP